MTALIVSREIQTRSKRKKLPFPCNLCGKLIVKLPYIVNKSGSNNRRKYYHGGCAVECGVL